mgnify:CR=1 FL=1
MNTFDKLNNASYAFSSCNNCEALCCDGSKEILFGQILLEDFAQVAEFFPILFTLSSQGYARPVVLLTNGKDFCKYIQDFKCTIYENRPSVCRVYPISPHVDNETYIDTACPAVSSTSVKPVDNTNIHKQFDNPILENYPDKYSKTVVHFHKYNKKENLDLVIIINGIKFYKFNKSYNSKYLKLHQKSLEHLKHEYFKL